MIRPAQTARSERTREALRQAALVRFLAQGVEDTSAEQIAADAGVTLRTFYRHFSSKHDLLFADYTGLTWFRAALNDRPAGESIVDSVQAAIFAFPYDVDAVAKIAALRDHEIDPAASCGISRTCRPTSPTPSRPNCNGVAVRPLRRWTTGSASRSRRARIAAAVFGAMEVWMLGDNRSLGELARVCHLALETLRAGITAAWSGQVSS